MAAAFTPNPVELTAAKALLAPWRVLTDPRIDGFEHLPPDGRYLLAGNHTTLGLFDVPFLVLDIYERTGVLVRSLGDLSLAEESVQEAFEAALQRWPASGVPPAPAGWIITTARNRASDRLRREASRGARHAAALQLLEQDEAGEHDVPDARLRLIFTFCHPALVPDA